MCRFSTSFFPIVFPPCFHGRVSFMSRDYECRPVARPMSQLQSLVLPIRVDVVPRSTERELKQATEGLLPSPTEWCSRARNQAYRVFILYWWPRPAPLLQQQVLVESGWIYQCLPVMLSGRWALVHLRTVLDLRRLQDIIHGKLFQGMSTMQTGILHLRMRVHSILRRVRSYDAMR